MNLRSLEYFLVVAEELNFSKAAERLYLTQQALSSHIKRLETEFDAELFHRKPAVSLTQKGEELRYWAKQILAAEKTLRANLHDISTNVKGRIRLGIARLRANAIMPYILEQYRKRYPHVAFDLIDGNTDFLRDQLQNNKIDMYIGVNVETGMNEVDLGLVDEAIWGCVAHDLLQEHLERDCRDLDGFLANSPDIRTIPDLPLLVTRPGNRFRRQLDNFFYDAGTRPNIYLESNSQSLLYDLAKRRMGLAVLSPIILYSLWKENAEQFNDMCAFRLSRELSENAISLVYRRDDPMPQYARDFIKAVQEVFDAYGEILQKEDHAYGGVISHGLGGRG